MPVEYYDPRARQDSAPQPYDRTADLSGPLTVGLLANGFPDSGRFLEHLAAALGPKLPRASFKHFVKPADSAVVSEEMLAAIEEESTASGMVILAPQSGRFYHRPAPGEPAFTEPGTEIAPGVPIGLIEVMKTFARVPYVAQGGLPERARVVSMIAGDGAEIQRGDPLLEVEPA